MAKELLEDAVLKPISISLNPKTLKKFDEIVGRDQRSKTVRLLIENHIKAAKKMRKNISVKQLKLDCDYRKRDAWSYDKGCCDCKYNHEDAIVLDSGKKKCGMHGFAVLYGWTCDNSEEKKD